MNKKESSSTLDVEDAISEIKIYKCRWVVLLIFGAYSAITCVQNLQYSIITNIVAKYYNVDETAVNFTGLISMITFILLFIPGSYLIGKYNLKITALVTCAFVATGNLLKLLSVSPNKFYIVLICQFLCGIAHMLVLSLPSKLASVWFGPDEVSKACALAVVGIQLGYAAGTVVPPQVVRNHDKIDQIGEDFNQMLMYNAGISCAVLILVVLFFRAKPDLPPSLSQLNILSNEVKENFFTAFKKLMKNKDFILILWAFGMANGILNSLAILLNTIYLQYFPGAETDVGWLALIINLSGGLFGNVVFGFILDKTHKFRLLSFIALFSAGLSLIVLFYIVISKFRIGAFIASVFYGFFVNGTLAISCEFATEITYPLSENISCSILIAFIYLLSILMTLIFDASLTHFGHIPTFVVVVIIQFSCAVLIYFISPNLKRRQANEEQINKS